MKYTISNADIANFNESTKFDFPKYTTQIINLANQNAQGTRPAVVGQMSELFPEYRESGSEKNIEKWKEWYMRKHPEALETATDRICAQIEKLKDAMACIDKEMVRNWVEDLLIQKTFNGMYVQQAILKYLACKQGKSYRASNPHEEGQGIDGFIGDQPYSVKPDTYKTMRQLQEKIEVKMVYYNKKKTGLEIEVSD